MSYYNNNANVGDMSLVNAIEFTRKREEDWEEEGVVSTLYDIEAYDYDENEVLWAEDDILEADLADYVGEEIAQMIANEPKDHDRLTDLMDTSVQNLDDVNEVNAMAKRIFPVVGYEGNERGYILTDGSFIYFGAGIDHISITRIDGMKIAKFIGLGNIRVNYDSFELAKEPTPAQRQMIRYLVANNQKEDVYVDVIVDNATTHYGNVLTAAKFHTHNPRVVLNQLDRWFGEHIKMSDYDDDMYESKKVELNGNIISESTLRGIVKEAFAEVIAENKESKNMSKARKYIRSVSSSTDAQELLDTIRRDIPNSRVADGKFLMGVARMYLDGMLNDQKTIADLNKTLKLVGSDAHVNEYDNNLNGMDAESLLTRFATSVQGELEDRKKDVNSETYNENKGYKIVPINSFKEASRFNQYTEWCVTESEYMFDSYTNEGSGRFYFCLKDGFQNIEQKEGNNCPLDEYGLSMIAVSVNDDGSCNTITCRWNHDNGGDDNVMTDKELSRLIGRNFYDTFKPWTEEELRARGIITPSMAQEMLKSGQKSPEEIFDYVGKEHDGWRMVTLREKTSYLDSNLNFMGDGKMWFDMGSNFNNGMAWVQKNNKRTFLKADGHLIQDGKRWFRDCCPFYVPNHAIVGVDDYRNALVDREGNFVLGDVTFSHIVPMSGSLASEYYIVEENHLKTYMRTSDLTLTKDSKGNDVWWEDTLNRPTDNYVVVGRNNKFAVVSIKTNRLIADDRWFDNAGKPSCGYLSVFDRNKGYTYISLATEKLIGTDGIWLEYAGEFYPDSKRAYIQLKNSDTCCFMDEKLNIYDETTGQHYGNLWAPQY